MGITKTNNLVPPDNLTPGQKVLDNDLQKLTNGRLQFMKNLAADGSVNLYPKNYYGVFPGDHGLIPFLSQEFIKHKYTHDLGVLQHLDITKSDYGLSLSALNNLSGRINDLQKEFRHEKQTQTNYEYMWGGVIALGALNRVGILTVKNATKMTNKLLSFGRKGRAFPKIGKVVEETSQGVELAGRKSDAERAADRAFGLQKRAAKKAEEAALKQATQTASTAEKRLTKIRQGLYHKARKEGGGTAEERVALIQRPVGKIMAWTEDKYGMRFQLYDDDTELLERFKERFGKERKTVHHDEARRWLCEEEGWMDVTKWGSSHMKLRPPDHPPILATDDAAYSTAFFNPHGNDQVNLRKWCIEIGRRFGPSGNP